MSLGCARSTPDARAAFLSTDGEPARVEAWQVNLDLSALADLPDSCFRGNGLTVMANPTLAAQLHWSWVPGTPGDLYVGKLNFPLGDAGEVTLPSVLHGTNGLFQSATVRSQLGQGATDRAEATLLVHRFGNRLSGVLDLDAARGCRGSTAGSDCAQPAVQCQVQLNVTGQLQAPEMLAAADY